MHEDPAVDLRFLQANERTLLAWIRTGLALMAFGFVVARLALWLELEGRDRGSPSLAIGAAIVVVGALCRVLGAVRFVRARRALIDGARHIPSAVLALLVAAIGVALLVYLLLV